MSLDVSGDRLYVGGKFTDIDGIHKEKFAAVDVTSGNVLDWGPRLRGGVNEVRVSPDGGTVWIGGEFARIDGIERPYFGGIDAVTGKPTAFHGLNNSARVITLEVSPDGEWLYVGNNWNRIIAYHLTVSTKPVRQDHGSGNVQAFAVSADTPSPAGGHFKGFDDGTERMAFAAFNRFTGAVTAWDPKQPSSTRASGSSSSTTVSSSQAEGSSGSTASSTASSQASAVRRSRSRSRSPTLTGWMSSAPRNPGSTTCPAFRSPRTTSTSSDGTRRSGCTTSTRARATGRRPAPPRRADLELPLPHDDPAAGRGRSPGARTGPDRVRQVRQARPMADYSYQRHVDWITAWLDSSTCGVTAVRPGLGLTHRAADRREQGDRFTG